MGWLNINGNWIGRNRGKSWSSYCTPLNLVLAEIVGGVRLTWEQDAKCTTEDGFEIWVSIGGAAYALLDTVAADVLTYDDMTDYAGSTVEYKVRAYRGTVYSGYSAEAEIIIAAAITNFAVVWAEDHAVLTWNEQAGWDTEIYSSVDNTNWTLEETVTTGTETTTNHCWQGRTMYFRARAKSGTNFGPYCASVNILTPLVFKYDNNPTAAFSFSSNLGLGAGKTVRVCWGTFNGSDELYNDYTTTQTPAHAYNGDSEVNRDPLYIKISGDLDSITTFNLAGNLLCYGDLSKWYLPALTSLLSFYLNGSSFTGNLSNWIFISTGAIDIRIYNNQFTGDLSTMLVNTSGATILWLNNTDGYNEFTAPPRGDIKQISTGAGAGLYMPNCNVGTAALDAWFAWANNYFASNTPTRSSIFKFDGVGMGVPTGGNSNTDIVGIKAKYVAAGFTATITVNT